MFRVLGFRVLGFLGFEGLGIPLQQAEAMSSETSPRVESEPPPLRVEDTRSGRCLEQCRQLKSGCLISPNGDVTVMISTNTPPTQTDTDTDTDIHTDTDTDTDTHTHTHTQNRELPTTLKTTHQDPNIIPPVAPGNP